MWNKIKEIFKEKPCCYITFIDNKNIARKLYFYNYKEATGYSNAILDYEITDRVDIHEI